MCRRRAKGRWQIVALLAAALILWLLDVFPGDRKTAGDDGRFEGCRLVEHRQNDGDSFRIRLPGGRVEEFRLYFVDAPESEFRDYGHGRTNRDRIAEQARYFGLTPEQAIEIGRRAKEHSLGLLKKGAFTLHTAWDDPFGDRRFHAFLVMPDGRCLHESLIREGLARIHTKGAALPDGTGVAAQQRKLRDLEKEARRQRKGAWGIAGAGRR